MESQDTTATTTGLTASLEDYIEAILKLEQADGVARAKAIATALGVKQGSVTSALKLLAARGLIRYEPYSHIRLTPEGQVIARHVVRKHEVLSAFFSKVLRLPPDEAERYACRVEHDVNSTIIDRLSELLEFVGASAAPPPMTTTFESYAKDLDGK